MLSHDIHLIYASSAAIIGAYIIDRAYHYRKGPGYYFRRRRSIETHMNYTSIYRRSIIYAYLSPRQCYRHADDFWWLDLVTKFGMAIRRQGLRKKASCFLAINIMHGVIKVENRDFTYLGNTRA